MSRFCLLLLSLAWFATDIARAEIIEWSTAQGGNGHFYTYVAQPSSWEDALAYSQSMVHQGQQGYLATITSAAENQFIIDNFNLRGFLGGSDAEVEGEWRWVVGPEAGQLFFRGEYPDPNRETLIYSYWGSNEPNDYDNTRHGFPYPGEDYVVYSPLHGTEWNDVAGYPHYVEGFYVEFGPAIPEPGSVVLLSMGLIALVGVGHLRQRKKLTRCLH